MANQVVKVKREMIAACMTCPLCNKLLTEPTTVSLCLHTFCRKCIYEKLSDDDVDSCPVCNIDLGCVPVEKLRPDHNLEDIRAKVFPLRRRKIIAPEAMPSVSPPIKRKERSLSSLVVSTPKVSSLPGLTGRRSKGIPKKAAIFRGSSFSIEESVKREKDLVEESSSSHEILNKISQNKKQSSAIAEQSNDNSTNKATEHDSEQWQRKGDLWTPLNCLLEAATRTKSSKSNLHAAKLEPFGVPDNETFKFKTKVKSEQPNALGSELYIPAAKIEHGHGAKVHDRKNGETLLPKPEKRRRQRGMERRSAAAAGELCASAQAVLDASRTNWDRRNSPIWFSLVASEDQEKGPPLPQIPCCYLRIKNGSLPVTFIQKYLVKKLDLSSEAEVEIMCRGQPVSPTLQLYNLMDLWMQTESPSKRLAASVGSSGKDFVMVLSYARR